MSSLRLLDMNKALSGDVTQDDLLEPPEDFHIDREKSFIDRTFGVTDAAYELEGTLQAIERAKSTPEFKAQENYDPFKEPTDRLQHFINDLQTLHGVRSPEEFEFRLNRRKHEVELRRQIAEADGAGIAAMIAAGVFDPVNIIPLAGAVVTGTRMARTVGSAAKIGGSVGAVETGRELLLHGTSETRTIEESAINIAGATVLGGLLGAAGGALSRKEFADMAQGLADKSRKIAEVDLARSNAPITPARVEDVQIKPEAAARIAEAPESFTPEVVKPDLTEVADADEQVRVSQVAAARERGDGWNQETLRALGGQIVERLARLLPEGRLFNSPSGHAQRVTLHMIDNDLTRMGNVEGISSPVSVEGRVHLWRNKSAQVIQTWDQQYRAYLTRVGRGNSQFQNVNDFYDSIARASRRNDQSDIVEVTKASRASRKLYNDLFDEGVQLGQFAADARIPKGAASYLTRQWDVKQVVAREAEFKQRLFDDLRTKNNDLSDDELRASINDVFDNIRNAPDAIATFDVVPKAGAFKNRVLDINDVDFEDFLNNNALELLNQYINRVAPRIELVKKFGSVNLTDDVKIIREEYRVLREKASGEKARELDAMERRDIKTIAKLRNRILGDPGSHIPAVNRSVLQAARKWQVVSKLGSMVVASLMDPISVVLRHGGVRTVSGLMRWITQDGSLRSLSKTKIKKMGIAADIAANDRLMAYAELNNKMISRDPANRLLDNLLHGGEFKGMNIPGFTKVTLMPWWNDFWKSFDGAMISDTMISNIDKMGKGQRITKNGRTVMAQLGIDADMAKRIDVQMKKYGEFDDGFAIPDVDRWDDIDAAETFSVAVRKHTDATIYTPNAGNQPFLMDNEYIKTMAQFKSFIFAAHNQLLLAGFQQREASVLSLLIAFTALGALKLSADKLIKGKEFPDNPTEFFIEVLDYSGLLSIIMELNNTWERAFPGTGIRPALGIGPGRRFAPRSGADIMAGPAFGATTDILRLVKDLTFGDFRKKDLRILARNTPFNNTVFTYRARDALIEEGADALNLKGK